MKQSFKAITIVLRIILILSMQGGVFNPCADARRVRDFLDDRGLETTAVEATSSDGTLINKPEVTDVRLVDGDSALAYTIKTSQLFTPESALQVDSFSELLRSYLAGKEKISGFDFGSGKGEKTEKVDQLLKSIFPNAEADFKGLEIDPSEVRHAKLEGWPVEESDVLMEECGNMDLITILAPHPLDLEDFIIAAKRLVAKDGLIVVAFTDGDWRNLFVEKKLYDLRHKLGEREYVVRIEAKDVARILSGFQLVKFPDSEYFIEGHCEHYPFAFVYSPKWVRVTNINDLTAGSGTALDHGKNLGRRIIDTFTNTSGGEY